MSDRARRARILYYYSSQQFDTGSPKALVTMVDALDREVYEPVFWAAGPGPLVDELVARRVEVIRGPTHDVGYRHPLRAARHVITKARALRQLRIDLLHVNEFGWNLDLVMGAALARVPIVLHVHNPLSVEFRNLHRFLAAKVVFVSGRHRDETRYLHRIRHKTLVLHNAIDVARFGGGRSLRRELGFDHSHVVVGTVAQISHGKGIDIVLEAARRLVPEAGELRFVIIGRARIGEEAYAASIMRSAEAPALQDRVRFLGRRADIPDLLASMDIFLLPTRDETFGIVLLEAMAAGLPVVASRVGGIPEIVSSDEVGWLVPPDDPSAVTGALAELIRDRELRVLFGEKARKSLVGHFDLQTHGMRLHEIYQDLLGPDRRRHPARS
jgi:glycosyltransferase involved in cell wall biosynthesis